jgi:glycosyltransferase involved in cell wall biosynthesis
MNRSGSNIIQLAKSRIPVLRNIISLFAVVHVLKANKYPVCYINSNTALSMLILGAAAKCAKIPVIIGHSHNSNIDAKFPARIVKLLLHYICRPFLPLVITDYLSCSQKAAAWMFPKPVTDSKKVTTIYNPVDLSKYAWNEPVRNEKRKEHSLEAKFVVGHVGRFAYQKNHSFLLKIFKELLKKRSDAVLFLIGEGPLQNEVKKEAAKSGIGEKVIFFGSTPLVHEYMQMFDVFLLPSRFEGLPLAGIEAQSAGLPCVFSDAITTEAGITGNCIFLPLKKSPREWAEAILDFAESFERKDCSGEVMKKGFDLRNSAEQLKKVFYGALQRAGIET